MSSDGIAKLAKTFASNHVHCSLLPLREELADGSGALSLDIPRACEQILTPPDVSDVAFRRCIAVTGAGASIEAGLPLANATIDRITRKLRGKNPPVPQKIFDTELERLERAYRLKRDQLETVLLALTRTRVGEEWARAEICDEYKSDPQPVLGYEILAHMLKHRFLDSIINFNFDELLDRSVRDELDDDEYSDVLSDGDCPHSELSGKAIRRPIYIKPHGTVSHPATLRFTRSDYYRLPSPIFNLMRRLLIDRPVDLLVIGFKMQSFEFRLILNDLKPGSRIYYMDIEQPEVDLPEHIEQHAIDLGNYSNSASEGMRALWTTIASIFHEQYKPRNIDRHESLWSLFRHDMPKPQHCGTADYLLDRVIIELIMEIARGRGTVTMNSLTKSRCGSYFDEYKRQPAAQKVSLKTLCKRIGLKETGYGGAIWSLNEETDHRKSNASFDDVKKCYQRIATNRTMDLLSPRCSRLIRRQDQIASRNLQMLESLFNSEDSEIRLAKRSEYSSIFVHPLPIRTGTALKYTTHLLLKSMDWSLLLVSTEMGQWVNELPDWLVDGITDQRQGRQIRMVVADNALAESLAAKFGPIIQVRTMLAHNNNRHVTVFLDKNENPLTAIYFRREFKVAEISPILLTDRDDVAQAKEVFSAYWERHNIKPPPRIPLEQIRNVKFLGK